MPRTLKSAAWICLLAFASGVLMAAGQTAPTTPPEPIYWRQNLLTVPYQWSAPGDARTAKAVWLYVSRDRGASWQLVADGESRLLSFNYRAEADGEYWFAVRTTDSREVRMPAGMTAVGRLQPELKVIVDTSVPRVATLTAECVAANTLEVRWRIEDANLGTQACSIEAQFGPTGEWQPVPLRGESQVAAGVWEGAATLILPQGQEPIAVRATVVDLANNRTRYQTSVGDGAAAPVPSEQNWTTSSEPMSGSNQAAARAEPQLWPADHSGWMPFAGSGATADAKYGTPIGVGAEREAASTAASDPRIPEPTREDRPLGNVPPGRDLFLEREDVFHTASMTRVRPPSADQKPASEFSVPPLPVNPLARRVNSRSFALEYELANVGEWGVAKVEVWGTHDGGQTWQRFAVDGDNRSPVEVTVDGAGEYGFTIVVEGAGVAAGAPPQPGDTPALWIEVDLAPPMARILSVNAARGEIGGELTVTWEAEDDHLEPRPIALFYSSRPTGPWTPIATGVENFGEFTWPIERHVPRRVYLKLEARDAAGNVAAFQTAEPVVTESEPAVANWQRLPPVH